VVVFLGNLQVLAHASALLGANTFWGGRWADVSNGYLGLKFKIGSETHYGWARLSVRESFHGVLPLVTPTITGYAYETVPDRGITAGRTTEQTMPNPSTRLRWAGWQWEENSSPKKLVRSIATPGRDCRKIPIILIMALRRALECNGLISSVVFDYVTGTIMPIS
jgi:hypothetical protein